MTDVPSDPSEADDRRTAQDELIIECLAAGMSYPQTGEIAGCTARTVSRRMADRDFARLVSLRRGERVRAIAGQLTALADDAVRTIRELLAGAERDADRLRAAHMVLTFVGRFRADTDLEDRLHDLEAQLDGNSGEANHQEQST